MPPVKPNNLARLLTLIHHRGTLSRARLTRLTGLNRSTVSVLIGQLVALGLVYEEAPAGEAQVGRPSPDVRPHPAVAALAVNPEVDAVTIGLVGLGGRVDKHIRYATERIPSAAEAVNIAAAVIAGMRAELDANYRVCGIGIAVPGLVTAQDGVVRHAPHLGWHDEPVAAMLADATGYPAHAANDASLAAEAEMVFGAGTGAGNLVYLNGGASGIGGGIIAEGRLLAGTSGFAGELGHTFVRSNGLRCHCGASGCLETEVRQEALLALLRLDGGAPGDLEAALGASTDPVVHREVSRQIGHLATALRNVVNVFNPEAIVLDGFLAALHGVAAEELDAAVAAQAIREPAAQVHISRAALGPDLMMVGAAELAFAALLADPAGGGVR
ncbi:ROK family transcriptional regulator [Specibacter cremeus]|uniref:ROK family transcriptional regulator n=1 Tax=Specibacter cremeus TaxID=1629051 RepID=UPI001F0C72A6|nr:ROK family transcriptional regulator [Specibacter cremeus]